MILVRLQGGLGNQMFQYAFAKMLAVKNKTGVKIDLTLLENAKKDKFGIQRDFDLDIFSLTPDFASKTEAAYFNGYPDGNLLQKLIFKLSSVLNPRNLIVQSNHDFDEKQLSIVDNSCIVGRWQSEKYFFTINELVRKDFQLKEEFIPQTKVCEMIRNNPKAISLHVRRADYVLGESNKVVRNDLPYGNLEVDYYKKAIQRLLEQVDAPNFFIFSEDMDWAKKNLDFIPNKTFVESERSKIGMAHDLYLISQCKHHITSNSTFSWWGAYLSNSKDKIVIAPKQWSSTKEEYTPPYIIPENWIKV